MSEAPAGVAIQGEESRDGIGTTLVGVIALIALGYGFYRLIRAVDPGHLEARADHGVLELIVDDRTTLTLIRLGVIAFVAYLGWSVFMLVRDGRPVTSVAGVGVAEAARVAQHAGEAAVDQVRRLEDELAEANQNVEFLLQYVQDLQEGATSGDDAADQPGNTP